MFNPRRILALFRPSTDPYEAALRALAAGRYAQALHELETLLASPLLSSRERARAENKRGVALVRMERRDEARAAFESALREDAGFAPAIVNIGNLHLDLGAVEEAVACYERAVRFDDDYAPAHHNLGVAYKRLGLTAEGVRELRRAQRLEGRVLRKQRQR